MTKFFFIIVVFISLTIPEMVKNLKFQELRKIENFEEYDNFRFNDYFNFDGTCNVIYKIIVVKKEKVYNFETGGKRKC